MLPRACKAAAMKERERERERVRRPGHGATDFDAPLPEEGGEAQTKAEEDIAIPTHNKNKREAPGRAAPARETERDRRSGVSTFWGTFREARAMFPRTYRC